MSYEVSYFRTLGGMVLGGRLGPCHASTVVCGLEASYLVWTWAYGVLRWGREGEGGGCRQ